MLKKGLLGLIVVGFGFFILSILLLPISNQVQELRTDAVQDVGLSCTTDVSGDCPLVLSRKSAYEPIAPNWFIMETSPTSSDKTANGQLNSDLINISMTGLTPSIAYQFTVDYYAVNATVASATSLDSILKRFNMILTIGVLITLVVGVGLSFNLRSSFS